MRDLSPREFKAVFRCYNEFLKQDTNITAGTQRVALIFQISTKAVNNVLALKKESIKATQSQSARLGKQRKLF